MALMKGEFLMIVLETAEGFRATIGALKSLGESEDVNLQTSSLPKSR
jgi:hypothetical protein